MKSDLMRKKPNKLKLKPTPVVTTVTLAEARKVSVEDVERLFRFEASQKQHPPFLFEVLVDRKWVEDSDVYRFMYENKILTWPTKDPQFYSCQFSHKDDAKFLRDVLIRHGYNAHIAYGPDHRRVVGEAK